MKWLLAYFIIGFLIWLPCWWRRFDPYEETEHFHWLITLWPIVLILILYGVVVDWLIQLRVDAEWKKRRAEEEEIQKRREFVDIFAEDNPLDIVRRRPTIDTRINRTEEP